MFVKGDKVKLIKPFFNGNVGDIYHVIDVYENGFINFCSEDGNKFISVLDNKTEEYFEKYEEHKKNTVTSKMIEDILVKSEFIVHTAFNKCTIVTCRLPNGHVIVEYSSCVDPKNYDKKMGTNICLEKIINKVWELEAYRLQQELHNSHEVQVEFETETEMEVEVERHDCDERCECCDYVNECYDECLCPENGKCTCEENCDTCLTEEEFEKRCPYAHNNR